MSLKETGAFCVTVDMGTSNTRATLWRGNDPVMSVSSETGVKHTALEGNNSKIKQAVRTLLDRLKDGSGSHPSEWKAIVASGMITSNLGLAEVPHLTAPVTAEQLAENMVCKRFPEIDGAEIWFIPGVKNRPPDASFIEDDTMDMMRGEETETVGLLEHMGAGDSALVVLPGSHTKFVSVEDGRITGCMTTLAGEMLTALTRHTILADSLDADYAESFDRDMVAAGNRLARRYGLNRAAFMVRIQGQFNRLSRNQKANLLLGIVFSEDMKALRNSSALQASGWKQVWIAGTEILGEVFLELWGEEGWNSPVLKVDSSVARNLAGLGALHLARRRGVI